MENKNKLKDIFTGFRNQTFEEIAKLSQSEQISDKEKWFFRVVSENSTNSIHKIIEALHAEKIIDENDFDWSMKLFTYICLQEIYDLLEAIKREEKATDQNGKFIKNSIDKSPEIIIKDFERVIGGNDVDKYFKLVLDEIKLRDAKSKNYEEYISGRIGIIIYMFKENKVKIDSHPPTDLPIIANKIWEDSFHKFVDTCVSKN